MGFVTKRAGGGGGGDDGSGDELLGDSIMRCSICRRELLEWETVCPDDGGTPIAPGDLTAPHDAMLARLLAETDDESIEDAAPEATATDDDGPVWPIGGDLTI